MKTKLLDLALIVVIVVFSIIIYGQIQEMLLPPSTNEHEYIPENEAQKGLYEGPKTAVTASQIQEESSSVFQTREKSATVSDTKLPDLGPPRAKALEPAALLAGAEESEDMQNFIMWCRERGITLVGIKKAVNDFYYNGAQDEDFLSIDNIPNLLEVAAGLYEIPEPLLTVMQDKTFYLSHLPGRGYTVLGSWPDNNILANVDRGAILEQRLTKRQTIHEFAHVLDYHGIQGVYEDPNNYWPHLKELRDEIFAVPFAYDPKLRTLPPGYMDVYSTANPAENFAQHFMYYILYGDEFRKKAQDDELLQKKYDFFKIDLFNYQEYGL